MDGTRVTPYLLHHLLAQSAGRYPDKVALVAPNGSLSYRELDEQSNRLANRLIAQGLAKGDRVGIDLEKCAEAVVAIFGILKAGGIYVPLDPKAPARRKAMIVSDCGMRGLVTTGEKLQKLQPELATQPPISLLVDTVPAAGMPAWKDMVGAGDASPPEAGSIELDLAYILYTSGSTGIPKGVMISHRAALSFVDWAAVYFRLIPEDRLSNHAPLHFDLSVFDLFAAAAAGCTVVLVPPAIAVFPRSLAKWIDEARITVWYSVPSALTQLVLHGGLEKHTFPALRQVLFAGEVFPVAHLRQLMARIAHAAYFNLYGPTETNVCTVYAVPAEIPEASASLPIGQACANTEVFTVDDRGRLLGRGETGEFQVSGPTLMQGYWGRPDQSAEVLVPHPGHPDRAERVYRTGDLVKRDDAGDYHFVGRRDSQVKSRGYRIELGDVEAVMHGHPAVAQAVAIAVPHPEFGCILRGILVLRGGSRLERGEVAAFCADALPAYMIPADFEFRAELPMTPNGKVDRRALLEEMANA
jgi:amino acid adenylation domain-containing protein